MTAETVLVFAPEILLAVLAVAIYLGGAFVTRPWPWRWVSVAGLAAAALVLARSPGGTAAPTLVADSLALYGRWLTLGAGGLLLLAAWRPSNQPAAAEYFGSLLLLIVGLLLVVAAGDVVLLFVGLELVSIPTYILLYLGRRDARSQEATAKYFYLSVLSSAVFLYGLSFLYGIAGRTEFQAIHAQLAAAAGGFGPLAKVALVLILAGLGFRIAVVPFHFYAPDVYQGTTHANAALLSVVPKVAGVVALVRLLAAAIPAVQSYAWIVVLVLAVLTMTLGNVMALWQDNLRRLLAYSSIAHAGYLLIGVAVFLATRGPAGGWDGIGGVLFYLVVYAVATIGVFAAAAALGQGERQVDRIDELAGLAWSGGWQRPLLAWAIAIFMFSLTGIPPMAGFWGKLAIFAGALSVSSLESSARPWFIVLATIGVLNSAISAAYYLRIIGAMFFRPPSQSAESGERAGGVMAAALGCAFLAVAIGVYPGPWIRQAQRAASSIVPSAAQPAAISRASAADLR